MSIKVKDTYVRNENGQLVKVPFVEGVSAYDSAVIGGYAKTETEFYQELGDMATNEYVDGEIDDVKFRLDTISDEIKVDTNEVFSFTAEQGALSSSGVEGDSSKRIRTTNYINTSNTVNITLANGVKCWLRGYDLVNDAYVFNSSYNLGVFEESQTELSLPPNAYYRIVIGYISETAISPTNVSDLISVTSNGVVESLKDMYDDISDLKYSSSHNYLNPNEFFRPYKFKMQAHKGLSEAYPQNTLLAFTKAGELDYIYGIETDIQCTSDGVFVCFHDDTLDSPTNGTGAVSNYTYEQLSQFVYDNVSGCTDYPNEHIPKLEDYLKICRKYGKVPYMELKKVTVTQVYAIVELVKKMGFDRRCVFTSFTNNLLHELGRIYPDCIIEFMYSDGYDVDSVINTVKNFPNAVARLSKGVTEDTVNTFHENGILVDAWGLDVGATATYNKLINIGVEGCTCNDWSGFTKYGN